MSIRTRIRIQNRRRIIYWNRRKRNRKRREGRRKGKSEKERKEIGI